MSNLVIFQNKSKVEKILPIVISIIFGLVSAYILFFHHPYFFEFDGIIYYKTGLQILEGGGSNVKQFDTPIGGPVFFAIVDSIIHDGILTMKTITILSSVGIVFFSFHTVRNIFNFRIALVSQIIIVFNAQLLWQSSHLMNDIFPFFLISVALYFSTKSNLKLRDVITIGVLLGISSMMRAYGFLAFVSIFSYLIIQKNTKKKKFLYLIIFVTAFIISFSPLLIYNYQTHNVLLDSNSTLFITRWYTFQTPEWHNAMELTVVNEKPFNIFLDFPLFLKNYFYNLFFHNSSILFNFGNMDNISIIPIIPYIGMIPVIGGYISCMNIKFKKKNFLIILITIAIVGITIGIFGDIEYHFMALIISPLVLLGIFNLNKTKENLLPLLIFPLVFLIAISLVNLGRGYQLFPIFISLSMFSAIFIFDTISEKLKNSTKKNQTNKISKISLIIFTVIILVNIGYSFSVVQYSLYDNVDIPSLEKGIFVLDKEITPKGKELKIIGDILSKQPGIEESYVMSSHNGYSFYSNSKYLHTHFFEGNAGNSINEFVLREDWTDFQKFVSNLHSMPIDRHDLVKPKADYLIYEPQNHDNVYLSTDRSYELEEILSEPNHQKIPENFEVLYNSPESKIIAYKINWE